MGKAKLRWKRNFGQTEAAAELNLSIPVGNPRPREARSQQAQLNSVHKHGTRKDVKMNMHQKP